YALYRRWLAGSRKRLDGVGKVLVSDIIGTLGQPDLMGLTQHVGMCVAGGRLELVAGELEQLAEWVAKIERIHEAAVHLAGVGEAALAQPGGRLRVGGA